MANWPLFGMLRHVGGGGGCTAIDSSCIVEVSGSVKKLAGKANAGGDSSGGCGLDDWPDLSAVPFSMFAGDQLGVRVPASAAKKSLSAYGELLWSDGLRRSFCGHRTTSSKFRLPERDLFRRW